MLRKYLIQKYVDLQEVEDILGHSSVVYFRWVIAYVFLLFLVYVWYSAWHQGSPELLYIKWIAWVVGLILFFLRLFSFLNLYLDCLLFTPNSIIVFLWDWILEYRTEIFDWGRISVISFNQNSLRDKLFNKWDIVVHLWGMEFTFTDVYAPKKCVAKMLMLKKRYEDNQTAKIERDLQWDQRNFDNLVNALWEVLKNYMENREDSLDH